MKNIDFKYLYILIVLVFCCIIYHLIKDKKNSVIATITISIIASLIYGLFIPPNISVYELFSKSEESKQDDKSKENEKQANYKEEQGIKGLENVTPSPVPAPTPHMHKEYKTINENEIAATCKDDGSYDTVVYCKCGEEISRKSVQIKKLKHVFKDGVCTSCGYKDKNYVKKYTSKEIMDILSDSYVSDSGHYSEYMGSDTISVFAKERHNCFAISTGASYNLFGAGVQTVVFNASGLNKFNKLKFKIGGETGYSGSMTVEIYIDKNFDDEPDYIYDLDASGIPTKASIKIKDAKFLGIRVINNSGDGKTLVFYKFSEGK